MAISEQLLYKTPSYTKFLWQAAYTQYKQYSQVTYAHFE